MHRLLLERERTGALAGRLDTLSPFATLGRGYAIVRQARGGAVVTKVAQVAAGDALAIRVADGEFAAVTGGS